MLNVSEPSAAINPDDRARAIADEATARAAGFSPKPPIYAIGTPVNLVGEANFQQSRKDFEELPFADDACGALASRIGLEQRATELALAPDLELLENGALRTPSATYRLSERGFEGLCRFVTPGGAGYLAQCPPILRAWNVNHWLVDAYDTRGERSEPRRLALRTRHVAGQVNREIFATVGPRYTPHDIDAVAQQLASAVPKDARADVVYDGYKARINVLFHTDIRPERSVAGEIFKAGILVTTADDGSGAIRISAEVWRNLCRNLIILDCARVPVTSRRHLGRGIATDVEAGIQSALAKVSTFAEQWSQATVENVLERYDLTDMQQVFEGLVNTRAVYSPGVAADEMVSRLMRAWDAEPGYSKSAVVNAITRAAHQETWGYWSAPEELERAAGQLLYNTVWNVQTSA